MNNDKLHNLRHSLAHILASAVTEMFPKAELGVGPVIENGFFYDFKLPRPLTPEDISKLEKRMRELVKQKLAFERQEMSIHEAKTYFDHAKQPFKVELIKDIEKFGTTVFDEIQENNSPANTKADAPPLKIRGGGAAAPGALSVSLYKTGKFTDLCRGGHVNNTSEIDPQSFKLDKISGAYWRGDQANQQMQRIYGLAFETKQALDEYLHQREEAEKRDHRKLGQKLDLFVFSDLVGSGLPLYTPKGMATLTEIKNFSRLLRKEMSYEEVQTPQINKAELFKISGHYDKFYGDMFRVISNHSKEEYFMKPMNCPQHTQIYAARPRSYKDLPIKLADLAMLYRDEKPGELSGLTRLRSFSQDDAHCFCREDQIEQEFDLLLEAITKAMKTYGLDYYIRFSLRDEKNKKAYLGDDTVWEKSQKLMEQLLKKKKINFIVAEGEAAFYGPKMDLIAKDSLNREWQLSTIQLDFNMPKRFELEYTDESGEAAPIMIHSALVGSPERFFGVILEHFAGAFPVWLSPVQVKILPITDNQNKYAATVLKDLKENGIRAELDDRSESVGKKIREAEMEKIPYMIIIGEKEVKAKSVAVRGRNQKDLGSMKLVKLIKNISEEIGKRS